MGYHRAGFEVVGVDFKPQPHYPFEFIKADALTFPMEGFDVVHASPPCQAYTPLRNVRKRSTSYLPLQLIDPIRERLLALHKPYIIENVPGAPLRNRIVLCGQYFGLGVRRHRIFECHPLILVATCGHLHHRSPIGVYGDHPQKHKTGGWATASRALTLEHGQRAMDIDWMSWQELTQSIPPAYTEYIGRQLIGNFK